MTEDISGFYLCPDFGGKGVRIILLAEAKWTRFLRVRAGIPESPFFTRPRRATEPETHPNGQPWGWVYLPEEVLRDEIRWLNAENFRLFQNAVDAALAAHAK